MRNALEEPGRFYRPELDALRWFAFLSVWFYHFHPIFPLNPARWPVLNAVQMAGAFGVPLFFVLSAYLILTLLLREREETGSVHVGYFYVRRMLRIWPLYFALLATFGALSWVERSAHVHNWRVWAMYLLFSGNWYVFFFGFPAKMINPFWSISVEEQFYLFVPWVLRRARVGAIVAGSVALVAMSYVAVWVEWQPPTVAAASFLRNSLWMNSIFHLQFLAAGALLALAFYRRLPRPAVWLRCAMFVAGLLCWIACTGWARVNNDTPAASPWLSCAGWLLVLSGCVLLLLSVLGIPARKVPPALVYLGRISYGLYLFHFAIAVTLADQTSVFLMHHIGSWAKVSIAAVSLALTVACAAASYRWFETPVLKLKRKFTYVPSRPEA